MPAERPLDAANIGILIHSFIKSQNHNFFENLRKVKIPKTGRIENASREALGRRQYWRAYTELYKNIKTQLF